MRYHFENIMIIWDFCSRDIEDWLFVSRLTTAEVFVEPRAGRIQNERDFTRGVGTKNDLAGANINSIAHLNLE